MEKKKKRAVKKASPNIVLIVAEQQKASATSCYGNAEVPAPFTGKLAGEGIVFENAYSCSSICTPARCSFLTGVHPLVHGCTCHQNRAPVNLPLLPEILRQAGYYTGTVGHSERQRGLAGGFHEIVDLSDYRLGSARKLKYSMGARGLGWSAGSIPCREDEGLSYLMTERIMGMIDDAVDTGMPFFLSLNYEDAHVPYFAPPPFDAMVSPEDVSLPPDCPESGRPGWHFRMLEEHRSAQATEEDVRRVVAMYYAMIACADHNIARVHGKLEEEGLLENTWIIFCSDHGDYAGEKGFFSKSESLYECLLHVPLIIVPPAGESFKRGTRVDGMVETVDIYSTVLGIAGLPVPEGRQSFDLVDWVSGGASSPIREYAFGAVGDYHGHLGNTMPGGMPLTGRHPSLLRSIRDREWSYISDPDYGDETYDLSADPRELNNLFPAGAPESVLGRLRGELDRFEEQCAELRDRLGVVPGPDGFMKGWE